jgi:hypothetical protein
MAISTNGAIITRLAGALYNEYLSNASYTEVSTTAPATVAANWLTNDFAGKTDAQLATTILTNLGLTSIAGLDNYVAGQLTAAGSSAAAKGAALVSMLNGYAGMTSDATYGTYATSFNAKVAASLTASQTDGAAGGKFSTSDAVVVTNQNITLTSGLDYFVGADGGGAGNDSFLALSDGDLDSGDVIEGGAGTDSLLSRHTITAATTIAPATDSVEILKVRLDTDGVGGSSSTGDAVTYTLNDAVGVTEVQSYRSVSSATSAGNDAVLTFTGTGMTTGVTLAIVGGDSGDDGLAVDITATYASVTGSSDSSNLRLDGAGANVVTIASIETLNITSTNTDKSVSTTGASAINSLVATSAKTVNITAAGTTTLEATDFASIVTINASASTAAVRIDLDDSSAVTFTGGAGNDRIDVHAISTLTVDDQLDGGAGSADVLATSSTSLDSDALTAIKRDTVNFERLEFDSTSSVSVDMADVGIFDTVSFTGATTASAGTGAAASAATTAAAGGNDAKTISGIEAGDTILISANMVGGAGESLSTAGATGMDGGDGGNAITLSAELNNGSNVATLTFSNASITGGAGGDSLDTTSGGSGGDGGDAIYAAEFETVNIITAQNSTSSLTSITFAGGAAGAGTAGGAGVAGKSIVVNTNGTINISGAAIDLNLGTIAGTNATVNANGYAGKITLVMEDGANTFIGGSSKDTVTGAGGLDTYTLGDGADSVVIGIGASGSGSDASAAGTSFESITDFTKSSDELRFLNSSDAALTPTIATDSTATAGNAAVDAEGIASFASADDTLAERIAAVEAAIGGTSGQLSVFEHGGNTYVFVSGGTSGVDAGDALVKLVGVTGVTGTTIDSSGYLTLQ